MRPFQESHHNVSVGAAVDQRAAKRPPEPLVAQLGLRLSGGEPTVLIPGQRRVPVSDDADSAQSCLMLPRHDCRVVYF